MKTKQEVENITLEIIATLAMILTYSGLWVSGLSTAWKLFITGFSLWILAGVAQGGKNAKN